MTSHHAVLFSNDDPLTHTPPGYNTLSNQDQLRQSQFGIQDARKLIETAHRRPDGINNGRTILVATEFITEEAQQALLKILEEPPLSTTFVFVIPEGYSLLPTLESRFERTTHLTESRSSQAFTAFISASHKERFELIEESLKRKDTVWQTAIRKGLIADLRNNRVYNKTTNRELEYVARVLLTRGASNKFLLDHLALTLPLKQ